MSKVRRPALRYHGGKFRLASWLLPLMPNHSTYVEPFGGAAGVLLQKPRVYSEVYNDLDGDVVNFFSVLRDPEQRQQLIEACSLTPYARAEFDIAWDQSLDPVERARRIAIRAQMGFGSAGASKGKTGFRIDSQREYGTAQGIWALYPSAIAIAGERMQGVLIENRPATEVMMQHDTIDTLHFVDPPYLHSVRVMQKSKAGYYRHEMTDADHRELLEFLHALKGMVMVCGYPSPMYTELLKDWIRLEKTARISAGRGGATRTEVVWMNQACANKKPQAVMFA
jgi:DNA adenine methylase